MSFIRRCFSIKYWLRLSPADTLPPLPRHLRPYGFIDWCHADISMRFHWLATAIYAPFALARLRRFFDAARLLSFSYFLIALRRWCRFFRWPLMMPPADICWLFAFVSFFIFYCIWLRRCCSFRWCQSCITPFSSRLLLLRYAELLLRFQMKFRLILRHAAIATLMPRCHYYDFDYFTLLPCAIFAYADAIITPPLCHFQPAAAAIRCRHYAAMMRPMATPQFTLAVYDITPYGWWWLMHWCRDDDACRRHAADAFAPPFLPPYFCYAMMPFIYYDDIFDTLLIISPPPLCHCCCWCYADAAAAMPLPCYDTPQRFLLRRALYFADMLSLFHCRCLLLFHYADAAASRLFSPLLIFIIDW